MKDFSQIDHILTDTEIRKLVELHAVSRRIPATDLEVKTYLHLPRFSVAHLGDSEMIRGEIERLADIIEANHKEAKLPTIHQDLSNEPLDRFHIAPAANEDVEIIIGRFHYLNSIRENSVDLGLEYGPQNCAVGIITISEFDLFHLEVEPLVPSEIRVFSRIFTFDNLPKNATSYFIGAAIKWLRAHIPTVKLLLTYLNPNLGYKGTIYKATNWVEYAREHNVRYNYFNKNYVTDRFLKKTFGTAQLKKLLDLKIADLEFSKFDLHPLQLLAYPLGNEFRVEEVQDTNLIRE